MGRFNVVGIMSSKCDAFGPGGKATCINDMLSQLSRAGLNDTTSPVFNFSSGPHNGIFKFQVILPCRDRGDLHRALDVLISVVKEVTVRRVVSDNRN